MPSYLQEVKDELCVLADTLKADVEDGLGEDIDGLQEMVDDWKKEMWKLVEAKLKQSFVNGRDAKSGDGGKRRLQRRPRGES